MKLLVNKSRSLAIKRIVTQLSLRISFAKSIMTSFFDKGRDTVIAIVSMIKPKYSNVVDGIKVVLWGWITKPNSCNILHFNAFRTGGRIRPQIHMFYKHLSSTNIFQHPVLILAFLGARQMCKIGRIVSQRQYWGFKVVITKITLSLFNHAP